MGGDASNDGKPQITTASNKVNSQLQGESACKLELGGGLIKTVPS